MKVKELKDALNYSTDHDDDDLMIRLQMPSIGPVAMSAISGSYFGFDWEHGKVILQPERRLSEKTKEEDVYDMAKDLIMYLATKPSPSKRWKYETDQAKKILLRAGYTEEQLVRYANIFHKEK
jgi:hypothetical protein